MGFGLRDFLRWFPDFRRMEKENHRLSRTKAGLEQALQRVESDLGQARRNVAEWTRFAPPGHFYSPLLSSDEIADGFKHGAFGPPFGGIDLNEAGQFARLERFARYYPEQPFPEQPAVGRRFHLDNPSYGHHDALMLYGMLREARPKRIIEVGSGFSSAAMLDLNDHALGGNVRFTFIDPDMARLRPLLREGDRERVELVEKRVQEVPVETFTVLAGNDVLFIDSSHVSKFGSDVNRLMFDVLPVLAPGVLIHIHDIAGNLEYPRDWLEQGRAWNEQYVLRAFLMHNVAYRIELFSSWLQNTHYEWLREKMPMVARGGGGQMWLRKLAR
jgi:predicted O-methyltransferase YrrM